MGRKEEIVDVAIGLFNERGTVAISTNHIASALGISPGNLYYHYKNKEEIIRVIFGRMIGAWGALWEVPEVLGVGVLWELMGRQFSLHWEYRFFQRELVGLLHRDEELKAAYRAVVSQRMDELERLMDAMVGAGLLLFTSPKRELMALLKATWIVGDFWMTFLELAGDPEDPTQLREGIWTVMLLFKPYMSDAAKEALASRNPFEEE